MDEEADERNIILKPEILDKHRHYQALYKPNDLYWGIGIEREFYLQSAQSKVVSRKWILENQRPERYSVRYFNSYKSIADFNNSIRNIYREDESIELPVLFNAHALYRCDRAGQHQTTYEREPKPNRRHDNTVLFEYFMRGPASKFFLETYEKGFIFDGDSIEIVTQNFYKCTAEDSIDELQRLSAAWIQGANASFRAAGVLTEHLPLRWATANHGLAVMWTNPGNAAIFNNGTYHINLTAPTRLDSKGLIANRASFVRRHMRIIRFFQWIQPLLIATFGTGDFLARQKVAAGFAGGSLRCAMSRYIGVGTYDSIAAQNGKQLSVLARDAPICGPNGWYAQLHAGSKYNELSELGLDILFNKHFNHGIELRIFDWFPEGRLYELLRILIYSMDQALSLADIPDCRSNHLWNRVTMRAISEGGRLRLWNNERAEFNRALGLRLKGFEIREIWTSLNSCLSRWKGTGECSRVMLRPEPGCRCT
jgi:hypothetical protein